MTGTYESNPMPHKLDVKCPSCGNKSSFEFAEFVKIELKADVPYFEKSSIFDYQVFTDSCGHKWHAAIYFAGLHGGSTSAINNLPTGYVASNWSHSKYLRHNHGLDLGSINCSSCQLRKKYNLSWPDEAYFSVNYKHHQLWAYHAESALDLLNYISGTKRDIKDYKWSCFLLHVPTVFKEKRARDHVAKQLRRLL